MHRRELIILTALAACLAGAILLVTGSGPRDADDAAPVGAPVAASAAADQEPAAEAVVEAEGPQPAVIEMPGEDRIEQPVGWRAGVVRGDVTISAEVVQDLRVIQIRLQEAIAAATAYTSTERVEFDPRAGTPSFEFHDVPFSEHGYRVTAFAEGFNGSERFVQITENHALADIALTISAGAPFTVLLRDQFRMPVTDTTVFMVAVGNPLGRPNQQKNADNFGAAIFGNVLQGGYEIRVGAMNESLVEPVKIDVIAHSGIGSTTIEVPRGMRVEVIVQAAGGWGLRDAEVEIYATDTVQSRRYQKTTDFSGRATFEHLTPGTYQLNVRAEKFGPRSRNLVISADKPPDPVVITMSLQ